MPTNPLPALPMTRDDFQRLERLTADLQATLKQIVHDQEIQFTRIAQLQADIDMVRGAWTKLTPPAKRPDDPQYSGQDRRRVPRKAR
jgi:hypothetical protein